MKNSAIIVQQICLAGFVMDSGTVWEIAELLNAEWNENECYFLLIFFQDVKLFQTM